MAPINDTGYFFYKLSNIAVEQKSIATDQSNCVFHFSYFITKILHTYLPAHILEAENAEEEIAHSHQLIN